VTSLGEYAFQYCSGLTSVTFANGVTTVGPYAFYDCAHLASVTIPDSVTSVGEGAFAYCAGLVSITIPASVATIGDGAFKECGCLARVYFLGNAPGADSTVFSDDNSNPTVYFLPGTIGWNSPYALRQALLWNPLIQTSGTNFGLRGGQFGFNITGTPYIPILVQASASLANPVWVPLQTFALPSGGLVYFADPQWTNYPGRFYRIASY
jgi:hypothetical protein